MPFNRRNQEETIERHVHEIPEPIMRIKTPNQETAEEDVKEIPRVITRPWTDMLKKRPKRGAPLERRTELLMKSHEQSQAKSEEIQLIH